MRLAIFASLAAATLLVGSAADARPKKKNKKPPDKPPAAAPAQPEPAEDETPDQGAAEPIESTREADSEAATAEGEPTANQPAGIDVDSLRREYLALRDQLFRSRARAAAVASQMYSSKLRIHLDWDSSRFYGVTRAVVRLDGANVFDDAEGKIGDDKAPRWDGYIAPGRHQVTIRIEAVGKDDQRFTTATESTFVVMAVAGADTVVKCVAKDDGDIAYNWQRKQKGTYEIDLDISITTEKRKVAGKGVREQTQRSASR